MKGIFLVLTLCVLLTGCSTIQTAFYDNATIEQQHAALCADAQFGIALADVMLDESTSEAALRYWNSYRKGAVLALKTYCLPE
jgi:uncharacterized protein YceK